MANIWTHMQLWIDTKPWIQDGELLWITWRSSMQCNMKLMTKTCHGISVVARGMRQCDIECRTKGTYCSCLVNFMSNLLSQFIKITLTKFPRQSKSFLKNSSIALHSGWKINACNWHSHLMLANCNSLETFTFQGNGSLDLSVYFLPQLSDWTLRNNMTFRDLPFFLEWMKNIRLSNSQLI